MGRAWRFLINADSCAVTVVMDGVLVRLSHVLERIIASLSAKSLQQGGRNDALLVARISIHSNEIVQHVINAIFTQRLTDPESADVMYDTKITLADTHSVDNSF